MRFPVFLMLARAMKAFEPPGNTAGKEAGRAATGGEALTISVYPRSRVFRKANMSDDRMARPVSGEIMTDGRPGTARGNASRGDAEDIIDADFETIVPGPAARAAAKQPTPDAAMSGASGMEVLRGGPGGGNRRGGPAFWTFGLVLVVGAFWVSGGHAIVSRNGTATAPQAASAPFRQPLRIVNVVSRIERRGERSFLLVDGEVANPGSSPARVPGLTIIVTGLDARETRYNLGTSDGPLAPGDRLAFSSRLHAPNEGVRSVTVDFRKESDG